MVGDRLCNFALKLTLQKLLSIPIFVKSNDNVIHIIPSYSEKMEVEEGNVLMYLGKKLKIKEEEDD